MFSEIWWLYCSGLNMLTHKQLESHGRVLSTKGTDALVLKHQAIITISADLIFIVLDFNFIRKCYIYWD